MIHDSRGSTHPPFTPYSAAPREENPLIAIRFARIVAFALAFVAPLSAGAATYYVAPTGSDAAAGTMAAPFASWARAQTAAVAGDTVYFRGGTYAYTDATSTCGEQHQRDGQRRRPQQERHRRKPHQLLGLSGRDAVFDFSGITDSTNYNCRQAGVRVEGDWLYLKGLELKGTLQLNNLNHESWCVYVNGGSNNTFELLNAHHNMGPGFLHPGGREQHLPQLRLP